MSTNFYTLYREWQYKKITPRIIIERFIEGDPEFDLIDYRVFCSHGIPQLIQVEIDTYSNHTRAFYDIGWKRQPYTYNYPLTEKQVPRPKKINEMLEIASQLTNSLNFCRVDFYIENEKIIVGELTFTPIAGYALFQPIDFDFELGELIDLKSISTKSRVSSLIKE